MKRLLKPIYLFNAISVLVIAFWGFFASETPKYLYLLIPAACVITVIHAIVTRGKWGILLGPARCAIGLAIGYFAVFAIVIWFVWAIINYGFMGRSVRRHGGSSVNPGRTTVMEIDGEWKTVYDLGNGTYQTFDGKKYDAYGNFKM